MRAQFTFHPERCTGCGACVMACINEKNIDVDEQLPYRLRKKNEYGEGENADIVYFIHGCMHCPEHPCVETCPKGCLSVDRSTGTVQLNPSACIGCHRCEKSCAYSAIQFTKERKASKCDGCIARLKRDQLPLCVLACPRQALTITEKNDVVQDGLAALRKELQQFRQREEGSV